MNNLVNYIQSRISVDQSEIDLISKYFITETISSQSLLLEAGNVERFIYFLNIGIVKGYQNINGKIVVQHLVSENDFFTSLDSFMEGTPSLDYYETVTECTITKISKADFDTLQKDTSFWSTLVKEITNEHLSCKLDRVKDFQTLSAKERYLKLVDQHPNIVLNVSVDNIASFLGMEPQSLSRIRRQITF